MSFKFSKRSLDSLKTLHPELQRLCNELIKHVDFTILEGVRTVERQKELVAQGKSKTMDSRHLPDAAGVSQAMDIMVAPIDWDDWHKNYYFAGFVVGLATSMGIPLRSGGNWKGDFQVKNQKFVDLPHFELVIRGYSKI